MGLKVKVFAGPCDYDPARLYREDDDELLVGVDSGLDAMIQAGIRVDLAIGDFDSVRPATAAWVRSAVATVVELPVEKDLTDLAYCLDYLYNRYVYDSIVVYGGLGGRIDHLLANLNLMKRFDLSFEDDTRRAFVLKPGVHRVFNRRKYVSFFALEDVYGLSLSGFRYELSGRFLGTSDSLCVSNEGTGTVAFAKGRLLVIETDEPEIH